jgi:hypothetical protein
LCVIGHLREEKDPLRAMHALAHLPDDSNLELVQIGDSLDDKLAEAAREGMKRDKRYRWLGSVSHRAALKLLASSHAMIISSRMEGGANVVSEAIRIGVPVIASRISGNVGLLGAAYPAYYPAWRRARARKADRASSGGSAVLRRSETTTRETATDGQSRERGPNADPLYRMKFRRGSPLSCFCREPVLRPQPYGPACPCRQRAGSRPANYIENPVIEMRDPSSCRAKDRADQQG